MSNFTMNLRNIENMKNDHERIEVSNFYVTNYLRENDCCISSEDWGVILYYDYDPWCLIDEITEHWTPEMKRKIAHVWWDEFKNIEADDEGMITIPFMFWSERNSQFDIMEAFKDFFDIDVITDKDFMGMKSIEEGFDMSEPKKEVSYTFEDGEQADVYRHGNNDYSVCFHNGDYSVRGSLWEVMDEVKECEKHSRQTDKKEEGNHPMVSVGTYINLWTTGGDYDVFIIIHEAEPQEHFDKIIDNDVDDKCQDIMQNKRLTMNEKIQIIETIMGAYTDFGVQIIMRERK